MLGFVVGPNDPIANWARQESAGWERRGVFHEIPLTRAKNIRLELARIARLGWILSTRLDAHGNRIECRGTNCGGYTLEAELGIIPNSNAEPDFAGWEVKQFAVRDLANPIGQRVTLMTPEPDGGLYTTLGVEGFVRRFGYPDQRGREDRWNFGGEHRCGRMAPRTRTTMDLVGYFDDGTFDSRGSVVILSEDGEVAASWSFRGLLNHWRLKHARAVYVPSCRTENPTRYRYGAHVLACLGADFSRLLQAFRSGSIRYDPAIKLENASSTYPTMKRRSQFRINAQNLHELYASHEWWDLEAS
jgi:hypothetical protein